MECELPNVEYYMKGGKLCNDVDILDIIWNVYVFEVKGCCVNC
jgi:hypothetical protein